MAHNAGDGDSEVNGLLANAESWDPSQTELVLILLCAGGIIGVAAMVGLVIIAIKRRQHTHTQPIFTAVMFWGLISLGSIVYATITQLNWDKQYFCSSSAGMAIRMTWGRPCRGLPGPCCSPLTLGCCFGLSQT